MIYIARIEKIKDPTIRVWLSIDDLDLIDDYKWFRQNHGKWQYAYRSTKNKDGKSYCLAMHRVIGERILGRPLVKGEVVDHIDGNGMHNNRENLRVCSVKENTWNTKRHAGKSGYVGVARVETKTRLYWRAQIIHSGKTQKLGEFTTPEAASQAYQAAVKKFRGEFAPTERVTPAPLTLPPLKEVTEPIGVPRNMDIVALAAKVNSVIVKPKSQYPTWRILTDEDTQPIVIPEGWPYKVPTP